MIIFADGQGRTLLFIHYKAINYPFATFCKQ